MRITHAIPRTAMLAAVPVALLATSAPALHAAPAAEAKAPAAAYVLNTDTGHITTGSTAFRSAGTKSLGVFNGTATDSQILKASGQPGVIADTTFAIVPNKAERSAWAASDRFTDLSWAAMDGATWQIYKNNQFIGRTTGHSFRDTSVTPGTEATYKITGGSAKADKRSTWVLNTTTPAAADTATLQATARQLEAKAKKYTKTTVVWRSFIRQKWATVPKKLGSVSGCKYTSGYKYAGDNRGYSAKITGPSHRAGVRGIINWTKSQYEYFPTTGWTKVYKNNGKFVAKRKASTKNIDFRAMTRHDGKTRAVRGIVEATDPFCPSSGPRRAGIGVTFDMRLARNGSFYASGKYRQAPDHELYLYGHYGKKHSTKVVHQSRMASLLCLSQPMCERGTIGNSGGY